MSRRPSRKTLILVSIIGAILLLGVGGVLLLPSLIWSQVEKQLASYGVKAQHKGFGMRWEGGLRFRVALDALTLESNFLGEARAVVPELAIDASYDRANKKVTIHEFRLVGLTGNLNLVLPSAPPSQSPEPTIIPQLDSISFIAPAAPIHLVVQKFHLDGHDLQVRMTQVKDPSGGGGGSGSGGESTMTIADVARLSIDGDIDWQKTHANGKIDLSGEIKSLAYSSPAASWKGDQLVTQIKITAQPEKQTTALQGSVLVNWSSTHTTLPSVPSGLTTGSGKLFVQMTDKGPEVKIEAQEIAGLPKIKKTVSLTAQVVPQVLDDERVKVSFDLAAPGLMTTAGKVIVQRHLAALSERVSAEVSGQIQPAALALVTGSWPTQLRTPLRFSLELTKTGKRVDRMQFGLRSDWIEANAEGTAEPEAQHLDLSGRALVRFPRPIKFLEHQIAGRAEVPLKILVRGGDRFYIEGLFDFNELSFQHPEFAFDGITGSILFSQSWQLTGQNWALAPEIKWNPFLRANPEGTEPLDADSRVLRVNSLRFKNRKLGPLVLTANLKQNLFSVPSWSLQCPKGRLSGVILADIQMERPRVGLAVRASNLDLSQTLPENLLPAKTLYSDPISFNLTTDLDVSQASALGLFDWVEMTPGQVHNALDLLDPLGEKPAFNSARSVLNTAYPTRVFLKMRGSVADLRINTNILDVPPVNNIPLSPYLVKVREAIYSSALFEQLKKAKEQTKTQTANAQK